MLSKSLKYLLLKTRLLPDFFFGRNIRLKIKIKLKALKNLESVKIAANITITTTANFDEFFSKNPIKITPEIYTAIEE